MGETVAEAGVATEPAYLPDLPEQLDGLVTRAAAAAPARTALIHGEQHLTYVELDDRVTAAAGAMRGLLPEAGATVAVASVLHPDFAVAYYATARAGHLAAVVNPLLREEDLLHVLTLCGARLALVDAGLYERLAAVRDRLPQLTRVVLIGGGTRDGLPTLRDLIEQGEQSGESGDGDAGPAASLPAAGSARKERDACVQFTSGTTGRPKAVRLSHRNLTVNAEQIATAHRLDGTSVTVNHLPTFHPMHLNSAVRATATQVLCTGPEAADAVAAANEHGATHLYSLPVRLARLAADPALDGPALRTVRTIASGGSALPPRAAARLTERFGIPVIQGYGLAETSPLTHSDDPADPVHGSVGRPVPGTRCRVVDLGTRAELPPGSVGEVQLHGPQLMTGYLGGPDGTGLEPDGWLSTGDVGRIDADGRLFLVDRLKDVFKCDNFLVSPSEVERVAARDPRVQEAVVVDLPDAFRGAVAGALVVLAAAGADPDTADRTLASVLADVNAQLPYYEHIQQARAVGSIPRSGNGKIQRRVLREQLIALLGDGV
ncbi:class I adenylate-forming enzyme family protein [Streptomyces sp. NPDC017993]|uniref:class I adenylate-forming enzyme family protein n=1 Tax=Streptomyces sp. NPDC017993 TaxID=3365027 RepID=UPI00379CD12C